MGTSGEELGPVEYMVLELPGDRSVAALAAPLRQLVDAGTIRIIDLVFVHKDQGGAVRTQELAELADGERSAFAGLEESVLDLVNDDDLAAVADDLSPGETALVLVWEDVWAAGFAAAVRGAGGEVVDLVRVPRDVVLAAVAAVDG